MAQNYEASSQEILNGLGDGDETKGLDQSVANAIKDLVKDDSGQVKENVTVAPVTDVNQVTVAEGTDIVSVAAQGTITQEVAQELAKAPVVILDQGAAVDAKFDANSAVQSVVLGGGEGTTSNVTFETDKAVTVAAQGGEANITTGTGDDIVTIAQAKADVTLTGGSNTVKIGGDQAEVTLTSHSDQADTIVMDNGKATIDLKAGGDNVVELAGGEAKIETGAGDDNLTITGGKAEVTLNGGANTIKIEQKADGSAPELVKVASTAQSADAVSISTGALDFTTAGAITLLEVTGGNVTVNAGDSAADNNFALAGGTVSVASGAGNDTVELTGGVEGTVDLSAGGNNTVTLATQGDVQLTTGTGSDTIKLSNDGGAFKLGNIELNNHGGDLKVDLDASVLANPDNYGSIKIDGAASADAASGFTQIHMRDHAFHHFFDFVRDAVTGIRHFFMHSEGNGVELANMDVTGFDANADGHIRAGEDNVTVLASNDQDVLVAKLYQLMRGAEGVVDGGERVAQAEAADSTGADHGLDGINFWMNTFKEMDVQTEEQKADFAHQFFGSSDEFSTRFDAMTNNDFVHQMYANIGANDDNHVAAMNNFIKQLDSGADRVQVTLQIAENELNPTDTGEIKVIGLDGQDYSLVAGLGDGNAQ